MWRYEWNAFLGSRPFTRNTPHQPESFCAFLRGQNLGQNPFCSLPDNG